MSRLTRRAFLASGALLGGGLLVAYLGAPNRFSIHGRAAAQSCFLTTWIEIDAEGNITVLVPHIEMGQGVHTALAMMAADELDADWSRVRVQQAPAEDAYAIGEMVRGFVLGHTPVPHPLQRQLDYASFKIADLMHVQTTGGSASVRYTGWFGMRRAGAAAREMLLQAAAADWKVPVETCRAHESRVIHESSGRNTSYAALVAKAARLSPPVNPKLKSPDSWSLCGREIPRIDLPAMVDGSSRYAIDVALPGLLYAAIRHAPVFGGDVISIDSTEILKRPGIMKVISLPGAVAVVADSFWRAQRAARALPVEFDAGTHARFNSPDLMRSLENSLHADRPAIDYSDGDVIAVINGASPVYEAVYTVPFLAHASMEPVNATAWFHDGGLEIWAGTQDPLAARAAAAGACHLNADRVTVHPMPLGGAFGRRLPNGLDFISEAAQVAVQAPGPVKMIWSREEDLQHDVYRPAGSSRFRAALNTQGQPLAWENVYSDLGLNDDRTAALPPYSIDNVRVGRVSRKSPVPLGYWRSVEHSSHGFFVESFIDELAVAAGADPLDYRLRLLAGRPRHQAVLRAAADLIGWGRETYRDRGRGIAVVECFGSIAAQAAEVGVNEHGDLKVYRISAAVDAGRIINPNIARAQIEGGIVFGLTAALYGEITMEQGRVVQSNFPNYPMIRLQTAPQIDVTFIKSNADPGGIGEVGVPMVAPAVANALFAASGRRVRSLPLISNLQGHGAGGA